MNSFVRNYYYYFVFCIRYFGGLIKPVGSLKSSSIHHFWLQLCIHILAHTSLQYVKHISDAQRFLFMWVFGPGWFNMLNGALTSHFTNSCSYPVNQSYSSIMYEIMLILVQDLKRWLTPNIKCVQEMYYQYVQGL